MISYQSNISQIVKLRVKQLEDLKNPDQMLRNVATGVLPALKKRVHIDGKATDGSPIGIYSPGYMKVRTGNFQNSGRKVKGKNKGELKDAGVFVRGKNKGATRPRYNRTNDPKVILSLTRQMENDLSVVASGNGYGIGFKNSENFLKSQYNEQTYKKRIWGLSPEEKQLALSIADQYVKNQFSNQ